MQVSIAYNGRPYISLGLEAAQQDPHLHHVTARQPSPSPHISRPSPSSLSLFSSVTPTSKLIMCPPGVDQTCRTPQQWHILLPQRRQRQTLRSTDCYSSSPPDFLIADVGFDALNKLARIENNRPRSTDSGLGTGAARSTQLSPLEAMPAELLANILDDPGLDPADILAVGVCSTTLWSHALLHIRQARRRDASPFANTPLLCTGTHLTELPSAVHELYPEQLAKQREWDRRPQGYGRAVSRGMCPARVWNWAAVSKYDRLEGDSASIWLSAFDALEIEDVHLFCSYSLRRSLETLLRPQAFDDKSGWILRNMTAREYVRLELVASEQDHNARANVEGASSLSLDKALVLRICWGGAWGWGDENKRERDLCSGKWAGHYFDVVRKDAGALVGAGWQEVTEEIVKEGEAWEKVFRAEEDDQ